MSDIQAALGLNQLKKLPSFIKKRKKITSLYNGFLSDLEIELPVRFANRDHIFYRYIILTNKNVSELIRQAKKQGINCERPVFKPLHQYLNQKGFPVAERLWQTSLSLPIYPSLDIGKVRKIATAIKKILS